MLKRHIVLLIEIRPSDGDVKPGGPLGAFREEQAISQHRVSPSPFLSSSSLTTQTVTHTILARHTGSDGSMSASGSAVPGFDPRRGS